MESTKAFDSKEGDSCERSNVGDLTWHDSQQLHSRESPITLAGYSVGPEIGRGGMGVVYMATEPGLNRRVAIKVLPRSSLLRPAYKERFLLEAQAAAQLSHDNIVPIYHIGEESNTHYFVMKLIEGSDLGQVISRARRAIRLGQIEPAETPPTPNLAPRGGGDTKEDSTVGTLVNLSGASFSASMERNGHKSAVKIAKSVAALGEQIAEALHHAHQRGIVHRDIKPSNLLLDKDNKVWVTDFGVAHLQNKPSLTQTGDLIGTPRYMSPEQASGRRAFLDHRTDIYSLGIALYELATLKHACRGQNVRDILRELTFERPTPIRKVNPCLPRDFETIICKATERNPEHRYQSADELAADLRRFIRDESLLSRRTRKWKYVREWLYERPKIAAFSALLVGLLLAAASANAWVLRSRLSTSEGMRAQAESAVALLRDKNPGKALGLAMESARLLPGQVANQGILAALDQLHEANRISIGDSKPGLLVFSPEGKRLLKCVDGSFYGDKSARAIVFDPDTGARLAELAHDQTITSAAFSPSGSQLLTAGASVSQLAPTADGEQATFTPVAVWNANAWQELPRLLTSAQAARLTAATFSSAAPRAVLPATGVPEAIVFNTNDWSQEALRLRRGHTAPVVDAIFSPDGNLIATWSEDRTVIVWDAKSGGLLKRMTYNSPRVYDVRLSFSNSSREVMVSGWGGIQVFSVGEETPPDYQREIYAKYANGDDRVFVRSLMGNAIYVRGPDSPTNQVECSSEILLGDFVTLGNGQLIAAVCEREPIVKLFNSRDGSIQAECRGHTDWILDVQARPKAEQFATVSWDSTIRIWNTSSNAELRSLLKEEGGLTGASLAYSQDGQRAVVGSVSGFQTILHHVSPADSPAPQFRGEVKAVLPSGQLLIEEPGRLLVVDPVTSQRQVEFPLPGHRVNEAVPIPDSDGILMSTHAGQLLWWSADSHELRQLSQFGETIVDVLVDAAGNRALAGTQNGQLVQFDLHDGSRTLLASFNSAILHLDLEASGEKVLVSTEDQRAIAWDLVRQEILATLTSETFPIREAWFAIDGQHVVTHAASETVQLGLWDLETQTLQASLPASSVLDFVPNRDRTAFAIASPNGGFIWQVATNELSTVTNRACRKVLFMGDKLIVATLAHIPWLTDKNEPPPRKLALPSLLVWDNADRVLVSERSLGLNTSEMFQLSAERNEIVLAGNSYGAAVVDIQSSSRVTNLFGHVGELLLASFTPHDLTAVTVASDGQILLHDIRQNKQERLGQHEYRISAAALSPDRQLLVTSDVSGKTYQWDLMRRARVREFETESSNWARQHVIGASNNLILSQLGTNTISSWDLRSGIPSNQIIQEGTRSISLSSDETKLLVVCGERDVPPLPSRRFDVDIDPHHTQADALLIDLSTHTKQPIRVDGTIVTGQFLTGGKQLALLSNRGVIFIIDASTLRTTHTLTTDPRCFGLLAPAPSGETLYAYSSRHLFGWNWLSGEQVLNVALPQSVQIGDRISREWQVEHAGSPWLLLTAGSELVKVPKEPLGYARQLAPWASAEGFQRDPSEVP